MITYKAIIQYFDVMCARHQQINSFTYGEIDLFDKDKFTKYPALHLTPTGTAIDDQTITYGFDVVVFDRYNTNSNKMINEASCLSDALLILQDVCKELTEGKYFINEDTNISMDLPIIAQPFIDTEPDNCSGWTTSFEVITPNEVSACNIPYYNPEIQNNIDVILPSSAPSTFYAWYSMMQLGNHATFDSEGLFTTLLPFKNKFTQPYQMNATGSVKWDITNNCINIFDDRPDYGENAGFRHTSIYSNGTFFLKIKNFGRFISSTGQHINTFMSWGDDASNNVELKATTGGEIMVIKSGNIPAISLFKLMPDTSQMGDFPQIRKEPLTIAVRFRSDGISLFYSNNLSDVVTTSATFDLTNEGVYVGSYGSTSFTDFSMMEFMSVGSPMADVDIINTMQWLNYR